MTINYLYLSIGFVVLAVLIILIWILRRKIRKKQEKISNFVPEEIIRDFQECERRYNQYGGDKAKILWEIANEKASRRAGTGREFGGREQKIERNPEQLRSGFNPERREVLQAGSFSENSKDDGRDGNNKSRNKSIRFTPI